MSQPTSFFEIDSRMESLREKLADLDAEQRGTLAALLDLSWIYHDNALEGIVLHFHELKAAVDPRIISDSTLIPSYDEIKAHKDAIDYVRDLATRRRVGFDLNTIKNVHQHLTIDDDGRQYHYRKENPLHRLYFHDIAPPEKISYKLRKLVDWVASAEFKKAHPILRATRVHRQFIGIFPWTKNSGKVARLLMNLLLLKDEYLPAVVHAVERQRYYEVLRSSESSLVRLVVEAMLNAVDATERHIEALTDEMAA